MVQLSKKILIPIFVFSLCNFSFSQEDQQFTRENLPGLENSTGSKLQENGKINQDAEGKRKLVAEPKEQYIEIAYDQQGQVPTKQRNDEVAATTLAAPAPQLQAQSDSQVAALSTNSLLENLKPVFSQVNVGFPNEAILTIDMDGYYYLWLFVNNYIGYVNTNNGDLLYCGNFTPTEQAVSIDVIDCSVNGNISDVGSYSTYPSNNQRIRDGSTYYYEDGTILKNSYGWYYSNGQQLRDNYGSEIRYRDGKLLKSYSTLYYPNGNPLYQYGELYYGALLSKYFTYGNAVYFKDGNAITTSQSGDRDYYWSGVSRNKVANYTQNDTAVKLLYPSSNSSPKYAKYEETPYEGRLFNQSGTEVFSYVTYVQSVSGGGEVFFDAEADKDLLAYSIIDGDVTHVLYKARVAPPRPETPTNITESEISATRAKISWASGGANTTGFVFKYAAGSGPALTCSGASNMGSSTSTTLTGLSQLTTYRYVICARNSIGMLSAAATGTFTTQQLVAPPAPASAVVSNVDWDSFVLTLTSGGGNTSSYSVALALGNTAPDCKTGSNYNLTTWNFNNLQEQSAYTLSVCAKNIDGAYSTPVVRSLTTLARPRPPVPSSFNVANILDTMADFSWTSGGGDTDGYYLNVREASLSGTTCTSTGSVTINGATTLSRRYSNLKPNTQYLALLCAKNSYGVGFQSAALSQTFTTQAPITPPAPTDFVVSSLKAKSVSFSWTGHGVNTVNYRVVYATGNSAPSCATSSAGVLAPSGSLSLSNLTPDTPYTVAVCAISEVPLYSAALVQSFRTLPPPPSPLNFRVSYKQDNMLRFEWDNAGATTQRFVFAYKVGTVPLTHCGAATGVKVINMASSTLYDITALKASTSISAVVCAVDEFNLFSTPASHVESTHPPTPPPSPVNVVLSEVKPTSVRLSWASGGGNTVSYKVVYALGTNALLDCRKATAIKTLTKVISGLKADSDYTFGVCAYSSTAQHSSTVTIMGNTRRPPAVPNNFVVTSKHDTAVTLSWEPADVDTVSYILSVKAGVVPPACGTGRVFRPTAISQVVAALKPNTDYAFSLCAVNSDKQVSKLKATVLQKTDVKAAPPVVTNFIGTPGSDTATLSWTSGGYNSLKYRVMIKKGDVPDLSCKATGSFFVSSLNYLKKALIPGTLYTAAICAYSESALYSEVVRTTFTTNPPPAINSLRLTRITKTSISIAYKSSGGGTIGYQVAVAAGDVPTLDCSAGVKVGTAAYTKTGLTLGTQYTFAICARASNGVLSAPVVEKFYTSSF